MMAQEEKEKTAGTELGALEFPNTPEGTRARAIADTMRALGGELPGQCEDGVGLLDEDIVFIAKQLEVPPLFIDCTYRETDCRNTDRLAEFQAWWARLHGGKAVA